MASLIYRLTCSALTATMTATILAASQAAVAQDASADQPVATQPAATESAPAAGPRALDDDRSTPPPANGEPGVPVNGPPPGAQPAPTEAAPATSVPVTSESAAAPAPGATGVAPPPQPVTSAPLAPIAPAPQAAPESSPPESSPPESSAPEPAPAPPRETSRPAEAVKLSVQGPVQADVAGTRSIQVKDGDTVDVIGQRLHISSDEIIKANKLKKPYALDVGQTLKIPTPKAYVIQTGDTLMAISRRFGITPAILGELNGFDVRQRLRQGQKLALPMDAHDAGALRTNVPAPAERAPEAPPVSRATEPASPVPYSAAPPAGPAASPPVRAGESAEPTVRLSVQGEVTADRARFREMRVGQGDTVDVISDRLHTTTDDLIKLNRLKKPYELELGQILKIPTPKAYVAERGDTLTLIGRRFGLEPSVLAEIDDMDIDQKLRPGEKIALPADFHDSGPIREEIAPPHRYTPPPEPAYRPQPPSRYTPPPAYSGPPVVDQSPAPSDVEIVAAGKGRFTWPVAGQLLSSFGPKPGGQRNDGLDLAAPLGTPVQAAAEGDVVYAGNLVPGFGNLVLIKHEDGWVTAYAYLSHIEVKIRDHVRQGAEIGQVGQTGGVAQPQLHFEVRYAPTPKDKARPIDPTLVLPAH